MTPLTHTVGRGPRLPLWAVAVGLALVLTACNEIAAPSCTAPAPFPVPDSLHIAVTIQVCR